MNESSATPGVAPDAGWLTKQQIADRYNISPRQVDYLRTKGVLPFYVLPAHCIRFNPVECDAAMAKFRKNGSD